MEAELLDWELVHGSDTESTDSIASEKKMGSSDGIDDGMILSHHFSQSLESEDSSRVDLGFDQLDVCESSDACIINEDAQAESEAVAYDESHVARECFSETDHLQVADGRRHVESQLGVEEDPSNSEGNQLVSGIVYGEEEIGSDSEAVEESGGDAVVVRCGDDTSKGRETVWSKMPLALVKYCAFRIGPVWSVSMAAAVMGFLLFGRRLYNIKNKPQRIHLKVAFDYKKVSQVMSQAARLNEGFTEKRRVPVIRPALPAPGAWPVLSLR
ncbi:unnamed protein product [Brassica oleracea var. botrytis]|uniref:BnaCnng51420D protein n=4 Tax=Brassica TaxID=3705 RepID=A0A078JJA5_BRANA|nr:PREDICTED: uncharacterized protein LOC106318569 isoform X1 [Brassica oleracea var. oleracea]XP_013735978.1 uncharacterized protein BNACNNG51420D isoform X1 [Brassica napus]KAG2275926.1 hypothetical protein Bca52824_058481 [Brassica carinata]VDD31175.1 unnamed protein product [Brassica oleracea]KAH0858754.1 hypothetical protein HID58_087015 [Brassica napus]CAF1746782.1 unnamed protein product [Brassica napus]CDY66555.1 BnaCnng51420D [Brassica napus]